MFHANCRPILIGSLPLFDHKEALQLILSHTPEIPLWPQLPKNPREGMVRQFLTGFPGLVDEGNRCWIDTDDQSYAQYNEYRCKNVGKDQPPRGAAGFVLGVKEIQRGSDRMGASERLAERDLRNFTLFFGRYFEEAR